MRIRLEWQIHANERRCNSVHLTCTNTAGVKEKTEEALGASAVRPAKHATTNRKSAVYTRTYARANLVSNRVAGDARTVYAAFPPASVGEWKFGGRT